MLGLHALLFSGHCCPRPSPEPRSSARMSQPLAALLLLLALHGALALRICSFNIRSFGETKMENQKVMDVIVKVSPFLCEVDPVHCFQT